MSATADLAGIRVVECPWLEPGTAYIINEAVLRQPMRFEIPPLPMPGPRSIDFARLAYAPIRIPRSSMLCCAETIGDARSPLTETLRSRTVWGKKSRGPRRRSRRT